MSDSETQKRTLSRREFLKLFGAAAAGGALGACGVSPTEAPPATSTPAADPTETQPAKATDVVAPTPTEASTPTETPAPAETEPISLELEGFQTYLGPKDNQYDRLDIIIPEQATQQVEDQEPITPPGEKSLYYFEFDPGHTITAINVTDIFHLPHPDSEDSRGLELPVLETTENFGVSILSGEQLLTSLTSAYPEGDLILTDECQSAIRQSVIGLKHEPDGGLDITIEVPNQYYDYSYQGHQHSHIHPLKNLSFEINRGHLISPNEVRGPINISGSGYITSSEEGQVVATFKPFTFKDKDRTSNP